MDIKDIYAPSINIEGNLQPPKEENGEPASTFSTHVVDFIQSLVIFGAIFAIIYLFIAQPHKVAGSSMVPTFKDSDYILTDKVSYRVGEPINGDIIVLKNPDNESQDFIKRIIGLPGDKVKIERGQVFVNDSQIPEDYLPEGLYTNAGVFLKEGKEITVPENSYLVFGDNRQHSSDSRAWGFITRENIVGKVFFRYWPLKTFGTT